jgi:hypothetical protein
MMDLLEPDCRHQAEAKPFGFGKKGETARLQRLDVNLRLCASCSSLSIRLATIKEALMRKVVWLIAGTFCAILALDRASNSLQAAVPTGTAQGSATKSPQRAETRLEKLQHYRLACDTLANEKAVLESLEKERDFVKHGFANHLVYETVSKDVQATWDRVGNESLTNAWEETVKRLPPDKQAAARQQEERNTQVIDRERTSYEQKLKDAQGTPAKEFAKKFEQIPWSKRFHFYQDLVRRLAREQEETHAALLDD